MLGKRNKLEIISTRFRHSDLHRAVASQVVAKAQVSSCYQAITVSLCMYVCMHATAWPLQFSRTAIHRTFHSNTKLADEEC